MSDESLLLYGALLLAAGLGSGFAGGLFGIGGGVLRIPIFLVLFEAFGVDAENTMHMAAGTSLALGIPTGLRSAWSQRKAGHLDPAFLRSWIPALLVGVLAGLFAMRHLSGATLTAVFGIAVLLAAIQMIALPVDYHLTEVVPGHPLRDVIAAAIGGVSTMIGVSGGAFTTPILTILGCPIHRALAVSAAGAAAIATVGSLGSVFNGLGVPGRPSVSLGYVELVAVGLMLPTILVAAPLGVKLGNRLDEKRLRRSFGIFLLFVAADMLRRAFASG